MAIAHNTPVNRGYEKKIIFFIYQGNRVLVAALSFVGLIWDGFQIADIFFSCSIVIWVWLPEIDALEEKLILRCHCGSSGSRL